MTFQELSRVVGAVHSVCFCQTASWCWMGGGMGGLYIWLKWSGWWRGKNCFYLPTLLFSSSVPSFNILKSGHFQCTQSYFGVSISYRILTRTTWSLMCVYMRSFCMRIHTGDLGLYYYSIIWRTYVKSAHNLTAEKSPGGCKALHVVTITLPFGGHARSCLTVAFESEYSCSAPLTLQLWLKLQVLVYDILPALESDARSVTDYHRLYRFTKHLYSLYYKFMPLPVQQLTSSTFTTSRRWTTPRMVFGGFSVR